MYQCPVVMEICQPDVRVGMSNIQKCECTRRVGVYTRGEGERGGASAWV